MKKNKVISLLVSMATLFGGMTALPVRAAEEQTVLPSGYSFTDIAHNGDTYVAMAKDANRSGAKIYYSGDSGLTWQSVRNVSNALISSNKNSQQQLVYWKDKGIFVAHCAGTTLVSEDGNTWSANTNLFSSTNEMFTVSGDQLIMAQTNKISATTSVSAKKLNSFDLSGYSYLQAVAAKPADESGNIRIFMANGSLVADIDLNVTGETYTWENAAKNGGQHLSSPYDMVYAEAADRFLAVDGSDKLFVAKDSQNFSKLQLKEGVKVTGVNANKGYIIAGLSDGTLLYTANTADGITAETVWTEIPVSSISSKNESAFKNIEFENDTDAKFVALSDTQVFKGDLTSYYNVADYEAPVEPTAAPTATPEPYRTIGTPKAENTDPFKNVRLIGGVYSPKLNRYVVYGNTATKEAAGTVAPKYWGKIFVSDDGMNWEMVYQGYTFSDMTEKDDNTVTYAENKNDAVWWDAKDCYVISASTNGTAGIMLTSADGRTWKALATGGSTKMDFRAHADIAVSNGELYSTNNGRQLRHYTPEEWDVNGAAQFYKAIPTASTPNTSGWVMGKLAISDEENPTVLMYGSYSGVVRDNTSGTNMEDGWTGNANLNQYGTMTDAVYSKNLDAFVGVSDKGNRTVIIAKDGTSEKGPIVSGGIICGALDTSGSDFMFAGTNGKLYTAADDADFAKAALTEVAAAGAENTMPLTNVVYTGENRFIATATDNTNSNVLVVDKGADGNFTYTLASSRQAELTAGANLTISVDVENQKNEECALTIIAAIYDENGQCQQVRIVPNTIPAMTNGTATANLTVRNDLSENAEMRVYVWDSVSGMNSLKEAANPFN